MTGPMLAQRPLANAAAAGLLAAVAAGCAAGAHRVLPPSRGSCYPIRLSATTVHPGGTLQVISGGLRCRLSLEAADGTRANPMVSTEYYVLLRRRNSQAALVARGTPTPTGEFDIEFRVPSGAQLGVAEVQVVSAVFGVPRLSSKLLPPCPANAQCSPTIDVGSVRIDR